MRRISGIIAVFALFCCLAAGQARRSTLRGHVPPALSSATDLGRSSDGPMEGLQLVFALPAARQAELEQLLARQQDPASADYHRWLSPEDYAKRFGASQSDIAAARAWLEGQGLQVTEVSRGRGSLSFRGTVRQVEAAFGTEIHRYALDGESHFANSSEPSVGAVLDGKVASLKGLHDFRMRHARYATAKYTSATSGNHYLAPDDYSVLYNLKPLYAQGIDGTGQKIAVVGQSSFLVSDVQLYRSSFGLPAADPQIMLVPALRDPGTVKGDVGEALLDVEWAGAVARGATILYVYSYDVTDALYYVIDQNLAPVISMSYGLCEADTGAADLATLRTYAQRAVSQGITWVAASGDNGAADCFSSTSRIPAVLAVDAPASIPEVTGVGGTTFNEGSGTFWNATNDANRASVVSYIPETAWNDSTTGNLSASGGGASASFAKPSWQTGVGVPADNARDVPDISLSASASHDGYLVYQNGSLQVIGGTSAGTPSFAGMVALLNQYQVKNGLQPSPGMGNINPRLYAMAASVPAAFHDITTGNNTVNPCSNRVVTCPTASIGYSAGPGYDQATGLGTVDAFNLATNWGAAASSKASVTVSLTSSLSSVPLNASIVLTATVTSSNGGTPTGSVSFFSGTTQLGTASLSGTSGKATATLTVAASGFVPGSTSFTASYNGDSGYAGGAVGTVFVTVTSATGIVITGAVNGASFKTVAAPGMILAVFGSFLAGSPQSAPVVPLPTTLGGVAVTINGTPAPLYFVAPGQINLQVPYTTPTGPATLRVTYNGQSATMALAVAATAPGVFAANGAPVPDQTAKRGQTVTMYVTGEGAATPTLASGALPPNGAAPRPIGAVSVTVGGIPASLAYLGVPSWAIGATQINYTVPANAPTGAIPVVVTVGGVPSAPVTLMITP